VDAAVRADDQHGRPAVPAGGRPGAAAGAAAAPARAAPRRRRVLGDRVREDGGCGGLRVRARLQQLLRARRGGSRRAVRVGYPVLPYTLPRTAGGEAQRTLAGRTSAAPAAPGTRPWRAEPDQLQGTGAATVGSAPCQAAALGSRHTDAPAGCAVLRGGRAGAPAASASCGCCARTPS